MEDSGGWSREVSLSPVMEGLAPSMSSSQRAAVSSEKKTKPPEQLNCPRCNSTNTKFCYYNNYSLTQPRYFCKTCRRYWTEGGSLRNVPVGGGSRKNKKLIPSTSSSSSSFTPKVPDLNPQNPNSHGGQDLNLSFPVIENPYHGGNGIPHYFELPKLENSHHHHHHPNSSSTSALELLRSGMETRGLSPYIPTLMPTSNALYSPGVPPPELKPSLDFPVDHGIGSSYSAVQGNNNGRHVFPFGEMKHQLSVSSGLQHRKEQPNSMVYWNGVMGEGSW